MSPLEIFNEIMFWVLWFLLLWNAYFLLFNRGVPNIKTSKTIRKKTIFKQQTKKSSPLLIWALVTVIFHVKWL
jgi:hypothetical protein